jgi:hypothetical protein
VLEQLGKTRVLNNVDRSSDEALSPWTVSERNTKDMPGARADRCLVFMSLTTVRKVWTYPTTWFDLTDAALLALAERRTTPRDIAAVPGPGRFQLVARSERW